MVLVVVACATGLIAAVTGAVTPLPGIRFLPNGHWVYNSVLQVAFHIDGSTLNVDAQAEVPGDPGSQVVQGDTSAYVVGRSRMTEFGKSSLNVEKTITPAADEPAVVVEAAGGPYAVFRNAGRIMRLGEASATINVGDPLGDPVVTGDGTLWLFRTTTGLLCKLPRGASGITCPAGTTKGHTGGLTVVADQPRFVDTTAGTLHQVSDKGLGEGRSLGVRTSAAARPAATDVAGRVAILDPPEHALHLVDTGSPARKPVSKTLPDGDYDGPVSNGSVVVVVDRKTDTVLTYDVDGEKRDTKPLPKENGHPRIAKGEDSRVYVEGGEGTHVAVVDKEGKVVDVPVTGKPTGQDKKPADPPRSNDPRSAPPGGNEGPPNQQRPESDQRAAPPAEKPKPPPPMPATVPGAPTSVSASPGAGSATVSWSPAADNRSPITGYLVSWQDDSGGSGSLTAGAGDRTATVRNLANGVRYTITVAAINRIGRGPAVAANPVTPAAPVSPPGMPPNLLVDIITKQVDATVTWSAAPPNGAPVTAYHVSWRRDDGSRAGSATVTGATLSHVIRGIWSGQDIGFTVNVVSENSAGRGPAASQHKAPPVIQSTILISRGADTTSANCHAPNCSFVNASLTEFEPNTRYNLTLSSTSNDNVVTESATTNANGSMTYNRLNYDVPGETVWVKVTTPEGTVTSNRITWASRTTPAVSVTKGSPTASAQCDPPNCHKMRVRMSGFAPNTRYEIKPFSSAPYDNPGSGQTTDSSGSLTFEAFDYSISGSRVWVVVSTVSGQQVARSAEYFWE